MITELEQSIIAAGLRDTAALDSALSQIDPKQFEDLETRTVYEVCKNLRAKGKPADTVAVSDELGRMFPEKHTKWLFYLADLMNNSFGVSANMQSYIDRLKDHIVVRSVRTIGMRLLEQAQTAESLDNAIADALQSLATVKTGEAYQGPKRAADTLSEAIAKIKRRMEEGDSACLPTGFPDLDELVGGIEPTDFVIIAGRPSMGKSAIAMNVVEHVARHRNEGVFVVSLEMGTEQLGMRMISSVGGVNLKSLRRAQLTDEDFERMNYAIGSLHNTNLYFDERANTVPLIASAARRIRAKHGLGLIVIDYLQLMSGKSKESRRVEIGEISRGLKLLAKELHVPIIALSQLSRACEERQDKRPMMSDLRETGDIEQDADIVMAVYRDEYYNPQSQMKGIGELIVRKCRNGETGTVYARWEGHHSRYLPITKEEAARYAQVNLVEMRPRVAERRRSDL